MPVIQKVFASIKAHLWWWIAGLIIIIAVAAGLTLWLTGFFGPSGREICRVSVQRAMDYGTIPMDSKQAGSAKSTKVSGRKSCIATSGSDQYIIKVDVKCKDLKKADCLPIYSVERSDGMSFYQKRALPDEDIEKTEPPATADGAPDDTAAAAGSGTVDTDIETAPVTDQQ